MPHPVSQPFRTGLAFSRRPLRQAQGPSGASISVTSHPPYSFALLQPSRDITTFSVKFGRCPVRIAGTIDLVASTPTIASSLRMSEDASTTASPGDHIAMPLLSPYSNLIHFLNTSVSETEETPLAYPKKSMETTARRTCTSQPATYCHCCPNPSKLDAVLIVDAE